MKPPPQAAIDALLAGTHSDPFSILGIHDGPNGAFARALLPGAEEVAAFSLNETITDAMPGAPLIRVHDAGLFEGTIGGPRRPVRYRCRAKGAQWLVADPYSFGPVLGPVDDLLIAQGTHFRLFDKLGAHVIDHEGARGVHFAVWAPNARMVSVVGNFNGWNPTLLPMRRRQDVGVWEIFVPDLDVGEAYKFHIIGTDGNVLPLKADPFAFGSELRPNTASVVTHAGKADDWADDVHRTYWQNTDPRREPVSIYEVHPGSWRRDGNGWFLPWDDMASQLIPYVADMGFTHIEFLPVSEHPYDPSWGYQTTGLYAPTARFGDPAGFARFVNGAHKAGIGVILDWVPAHFPTDQHGLIRFDGTALYEHEDPRLGYQPDWDTLIYNFGRREVKSFLINNALFWAEKYHVDGLRVDAVASMLYRDYSRQSDQWIPNPEGGRENWEAAEFLRDANRTTHRQFPGFMTIAEESTAWPGVTRPAYDEGPKTALGFDFKWNMGFMHDTLRYMAREPVHRRYHHDDITFGLMYAFSENFVLPLSHDEVVHGKGSLLTKMSGDDWQQFANLRAYYALMWGYPGKKLLFMGQEFAQRREWNEAGELDWHLLGAGAHEGVRRLVRDLNHVYRTTPALHARDCEGEGFRWLIVDDAEHSVFAWLRLAPGAAPVAVIANMTPVMHDHYTVPLPHDGKWREILNSDAEYYGGSGKGNLGMVQAKDGHATICLPPLATLMLEHIS